MRQDLQNKGEIMKKTRLISIFALLLTGLFQLAGCSSPEKQEMVFLSAHAYDLTIMATGKDGFDAPDGILWKDGKFYMADEGGSAFRIWTDAEKVQTLSRPEDGLMSPEDLVLDGEGNIFFTDDDAGGVWKIDGAGKTSRLAGKEKGLVSTEGIALAPDGKLLVGDGKSHKIFSVSRSGEVETFLDTDAGITKPESMVFDEKGNLYIADNEDQVIYLLTPGGKLKRVIENTAGFSPETIWYADGVLYITDSDNGKLFRYDPEKGLGTIAEFGGVFTKVCGITTDDRGRIYLSVQTHIDNKHSYLLRLQRKDTEVFAKENFSILRKS
jgi:sugar lactone lactonase YvrE